MKILPSKNILWSLILMAIFFLTSCNVEKENVTKTQYLEKYGFEVSKKEWEEQGQEGTVISTTSEGVKISSHYKNGLLDGKKSFSFPHSESIAKTHIYEQGKLLSEIIHYQSSMPQKEVTSLSSHEKLLTFWFENGVTKAIEKYKDNLLEEGTYFNLENAVEARVENFQGTRLNRDEKGLLLSKESIQGGQMVLEETYHPNGFPHAITPYRGGFIHGKRETFNLNGEPLSSEEWVNGNQDGRTILFKNGIKAREIIYSQGRQVSETHEN